MDVPKSVGPDDTGMTTRGTIEAAVILVIGLAIIIGNSLIICALVFKSHSATQSSASRRRQSFCYYVLSLATNDLLVGLLIVPVSIYPAALQNKPHADWVCQIEAYFGVTLWTICVYNFMWMSVDRYIYVKKPLRYESIQTETRCKCWMIVTWVTSALLCSPPLLGFSKATYYSHGFLCLPHFTNMVAYSVTFAILILGPSTITILYSYAYIFKTMCKYHRNQRKGRKDLTCGGLVSEALADPSNMMTFILIVVFLISWTPWTCLRFYEQISQQDVNYPILQFIVSWIGLMNSFWKVIIYITMSRKIRRRVVRMLLHISCFARCSSTSTIISNV